MTESAQNWYLLTSAVGRWENVHAIAKGYMSTSTWRWYLFSGTESSAWCCIGLPKSFFGT